MWSMSHHPGPSVVVAGAAAGETLRGALLGRAVAEGTLRAGAAAVVAEGTLTGGTGPSITGAEGAGVRGMAEGVEETAPPAPPTLMMQPRSPPWADPVGLPRPR